MNREKVENSVPIAKTSTLAGPVVIPVFWQETEQLQACSVERTQTEVEESDEKWRFMKMVFTYLRQNWPEIVLFLNLTQHMSRP